MPGLSLRRQVADQPGERRRDKHIARHHDAARRDDRRHAACEIHSRQSKQHDQRRRKRKAQLSDTVDRLTGGNADRRRRNEHHAEHNGVIVKSQIILDIDDEIWKKDLHRDGEHAKRRKCQIERRMLPHDRGAQAVDQIFEIRLAVRCELRLRHQCAGSQPRQRDGSAENGEEFPDTLAMTRWRRISSGILSKPMLS